MIRTIAHSRPSWLRRLGSIRGSSHALGRRLDEAGPAVACSSFSTSLSLTSPRRVGPQWLTHCASPSGPTVPASSPVVSPSSGHRWRPRLRPRCGPSEGHNLHHAPGHARGAPCSQRCGDAWRPRRGPLDGPCTCRLLATRHVEGGIWLLVGGGLHRDLGAARPLLRRRNQRRCCGPMRRPGAQSRRTTRRGEWAARRGPTDGGPRRTAAATRHPAGRRRAAAAQAPGRRRAGAGAQRPPASPTSRRAPRLANAPLVLGREVDAGRRFEVALDPATGGAFHGAHFSADDLGRSGASEERCLHASPSLGLPACTSAWPSVVGRGQRLATTARGCAESARPERSAFSPGDPGTRHRWGHASRGRLRLLARRSPHLNSPAAAASGSRVDTFHVRRDPRLGGLEPLGTGEACEVARIRKA